MKQIVVDLKKCLACHSCELACAVVHSISGQLVAAIGEPATPRSRIFVEGGDGFSFPVQCRHCSEPECVRACMTGCLERDQAAGIVTHESNRCIGCWMCVMVCPFGAFTDHGQDDKVTKCDRCPDRESPACVASCPTGALELMSVDETSSIKRKRFLQVLQSEVEAK